MNMSLQLKMAKQIWDETEGNPEVSMWFDNKLSSDEKLALEELLSRGVIKRTKGSNYKICSETKKFLANNGKTNFELDKEKEEQREEENLALAKEANRISKKSMWFSGIAIVISIISIVVTILG